MKFLLTALASLACACPEPSVPMQTANRTSGVAPLAVFFDAVQPGNSMLDPDSVPAPFVFADYQFAWSFGDDPSAVWSTTGRSKNYATGFVAAHVFELPGYYPITLRVTTPDGDDRLFEQTISVSDPEIVFANSAPNLAERTFYVSGDGDDSSGGSFQRPFRTVDHGLARLFASHGPRRLLLRRGDAFAASGVHANDRMGPYSIGAFGDGPRPVVRFPDPSGGAALHFSADAEDVRIVDVDFVGPTTGHTIAPGRNTLVLRSTITAAGSGISTSDLEGNKAGTFIADCTIEQSTSYAIYFNFGEHVALLGNVLHEILDGHVVRCHLTHSLLAHNVIRGGGVARHQLKFIGFNPTGDPDRAPGIPTEVVEYTLISDNVFEDPGPVNWMVTIGPTDTSKDQRLANVVFERNVLRAGPGVSDMLYLNNERVTVRNNVFDATGGTTTVAAVRVTQRGIEPPPRDHRILHNTMYRGDDGELIGVQVDNPAEEIVVQENLISGGDARALVRVNAVVDARLNLVLPITGLADPENGDFGLRAGSPAIDRGSTIPSVYSDFLNVVRPIDGDSSGRAEEDIGAFEFAPARVLKRRNLRPVLAEPTPLPYNP